MHGNVALSIASTRELLREFFKISAELATRVVTWRFWPRSQLSSVKWMEQRQIS